MKTKYDRMEARLFELKTELSEAKEVMNAAMLAYVNAGDEFTDAKNVVAEIEDEMDDLNYLKQER